MTNQRHGEVRKLGKLPKRTNESVKIVGAQPITDAKVTRTMDGSKGKSKGNKQVQPKPADKITVRSYKRSRPRGQK